MSDPIDRRAAGAPAGTWPRVAPWVAPAVLILVALTQIALVHTTELTAWKGGGFGMFSTTERPETRVLRCWVVEQDRRARIPVPDGLRSLELRARSMPTRRNLEALADALARRTVASRSVQVELWRRKLDLDSGSLRLEFRTRVEAPRGGP